MFYAIKLLGMHDLNMERDAFVVSLMKFTQLTSIKLFYYHKYLER